MKKEQSRPKEKKRSVIVLIAVIVVVLISVIWGIYHYLELKTEHELEMADLQAMRVAESVAMMKYKDKLPGKPTEFWFDARNYSLIPVSKPMPKPYGVGKETDGDAIEDFKAETKADYKYDESTDYSNKIIKLTAEKGSNGKLKNTIIWVDYKP